MTFIVKIDNQAFDVHDRFKNIIASIAVGERFSLSAEGVSKHIFVKKFTSILDTDQTVQQYLFEGENFKVSSDEKTRAPNMDIRDRAILYGILGHPVVFDDLAFYFSHLQQESIVKYQNVEYLLLERYTDIVTWQAPRGGGLWSNLVFRKV